MKLFTVLFVLLAQELVVPAPATLEIPFDILASRHMAVDVHVNGKGPFRMIFDTGAPVCLFSSKLARDAELLKPTKTARGRGDRGAASGLFGMGGMVHAEEVRIGNVATEKLAGVVMDHPTVKAMATFVGELEGIIGFPFFAKYRTTIDYQQRKMFLEPVAYDPGDVMTGMMKLMLAPKNKPPVKQLSAETVWGWELEKGDADEESGMVVSRIWDEGAAAHAGVRIGDRLLLLDGTWTESIEDCYRAAKGVRPGQTVEARIVREGKEITLSIQPKAGV